MPIVPGAGATHAFPVLLQVREDVDLGQPVEQGVVQDMMLELPEAPAERDMSLGRDVLVAEQQQAMGVEGIPQRSDLGVGEVPRQVDIADQRTQRLGGLRDGHLRFGDAAALRSLPPGLARALRAGGLACD